MPPPSKFRAGNYCAASSEDADARSRGQRQLGFAFAAVAAGSLGAAPFVGDELDRGPAIALSMIAVAVGSTIAAKETFKRSTHERAIASAFADCVGRSDAEAFERALAIYQLWIRPDASRAELIRAATRAIDGPPRSPPPPPPPWADEPVPEPKRDDVMEATLSRTD